MSALKETFPKSERLCSKKAIAKLFEEGNIIYTPLLKTIWLEYPLPVNINAQVAFSVSKRGFRKAVQRNLLRRRMKEAYRKNKHVLYNKLNSINSKIILTIIFRENFIPGYEAIEKSVVEMISRLCRAADEIHSKC
jgi:ribonuclease P protein component